MRLVVLGGNGQVGRALVHACPPEHDVIPVTRGDLDMTKSDGVATLLSELQPDVLVNAAAYTAVDHAEDDSEAAYAINHVAVEEISKWCTHHDVAWIHLSTDYVFDGASDAPYREDAPTSPQGVYAASKLAGEQAALASQNARVIRLSWVYGDGRNFVRTMMRLFQERDNVAVVDDQYGVPSSAAWIARCLWEVAARIRDLPAGIYHLAGQPATSWCGFAGRIRDAGGFDVEIEPIPTSAFPTRAKRPANSVLDGSTLNRLMGWNPHDWRPDLDHYVRSELARQSDEPGPNTA